MKRRRRTEPARTPPPIDVDVPTLRAMAHPTRIRILGELSYRGPATATGLARLLGESSGSTSYHLRQLSRFGLVEDDPDRSPGGRERWWRGHQGGIRMSGFAYLRDPHTREAANLVITELERGRAERRRAWAEYSGTRFAEAAPWTDSAIESSYVHLLTQEEAAEMVRELDAVLERWKEAVQGRKPTGDRTLVPVETQVYSFPNLGAGDGGDGRVREAAPPLT